VDDSTDVFATNGDDDNDDDNDDGFIGLDSFISVLINVQWSNELLALIVYYVHTWCKPFLLFVSCSYQDGSGAVLSLSVAKKSTKK
jgi:hypothetical protein